jgi:hypothetical protein
MSAYQGASDWVAETFGSNGNLRGSAIGGVMQGMADPVAGAAQFAANLPGATIAGRRKRECWDQGQRIRIRSRSRPGRHEAGFDAARLAGNIAAPSNVALASRIPAAAGFLGRAGSGAAAGAVGAAMTPETDADKLLGQHSTEGGGWRRCGGCSGACCWRGRG